MKRKLSSSGGKEHIIHAASEKTDIIASNQLKNRGIFSKNITLLFEGQISFPTNAKATKARK